MIGLGTSFVTNNITVKAIIIKLYYTSSRARHSLSGVCKVMRVDGGAGWRSDRGYMLDSVFAHVTVSVDYWALRQSRSFRSIEDLRPIHMEIGSGGNTMYSCHWFCTLNQERIEPAKPAREHVTPYTHNVNGEIQTWRTLTIYSSYQIWSETHKFNRPRAQAFDTHSDRSMACLPFDSIKLAGVVLCT